ncbi:hypothetical protein [Streptomyces sp. NPDC003832]
MALIDDIEFFGSRVDAGDLGREEAARLLAEASKGGLTLVGAKECLTSWQGLRARLTHNVECNRRDLRRLRGES